MARWVRSILVSIKFDDGSQAALELAKDVAMRERAELILARRAAPGSGLYPSSTTARWNRPLAAEAWVEREAKQRLAERVMRVSTCPVLTTHPAT